MLRGGTLVLAGQTQFCNTHSNFWLHSEWVVILLMLCNWLDFRTEDYFSTGERKRERKMIQHHYWGKKRYKKYSRFPCFWSRTRDSLSAWSTDPHKLKRIRSCTYNVLNIILFYTGEHCWIKQLGPSKLLLTHSLSHRQKFKFHLKIKTVHFSDDFKLVSFDKHVISLSKLMPTLSQALDRKTTQLNQKREVILFLS